MYEMLINVIINNIIIIFFFNIKFVVVYNQKLVLSLQLYIFEIFEVQYRFSII